MTAPQDYLESMALIIGGAMTVSLVLGILLGALFAPRPPADPGKGGGRGRPALERFGPAVARDGRRVWLDEPAGLVRPVGRGDGS